MPPFIPENFLPYLLNQAAEQTSLAFSTVYRDRYNMLRTEWRVLFHLGHYGDMTASDIARLSKMHKTKISRAVKALEDKRFIAKRAASEDRRRDTLSLRPEGRRAFDDLCAIAARHNARLLAPFSPGERLILLDCLQRLSGLADSAPDSSRL
ncbi:DNA-binding transcriptional regulator, MarR family [Roseivivax lentus]|uniref:DNA-binding transcriptional regulator, MarR family n=1 Tax=Roseivivax lentus TaxID=633194 RepID=A0A1N7P318_9RHOB|nr:MarR family winged helix-turn-helix transcriptional regulator [Roseivivax lentus]SIT04819.1 DNA-binding transcriptional regulator, MarR family [Roseivivax lentus]